MNKYGLIGRNISYSFSEKYFKDKFKKEEIKNSIYKIYDIDKIEDILDIIKTEKTLKGLNVTIPYKEVVIDFLDSLSIEAQKIKSVNTIRIHNGKLEGFNTDYFGFDMSISPYIKSYHKATLILGTGGSSKAIKYVLENKDIDFIFVSRNPKEKNQIRYSDINKDIIDKFNIIINCTPIGTYPNLDSCPDIPYKYINEKNLIYDLTYNPPETLFIKKAKSQGATTINGMNMLKLQADKSWQIWNYL